MKIDDKINDEKVQQDIKEKKPKYQLYYQVRLMNMNLLPSDQSRIIEQAKLTYLSGDLHSVK